MRDVKSVQRCIVERMWDRHAGLRRNRNSIGRGENIGVRDEHLRGVFVDETTEPPPPRLLKRDQPDRAMLVGGKCRVPQKQRYRGIKCIALHHIVMIENASPLRDQCTVRCQIVFDGFIRHVAIIGTVAIRKFCADAGGVHHPRISFRL